MAVLWTIRRNLNTSTRQVPILRLPVTLWNLDVCRSKKEVFLVEGIIDGLTFVDRGLKNCVSLFGTQGLPDARLEVLKKRTQIKRFVLVFDTDRNHAGQTGALKTGAKLFRVNYVKFDRQLALDQRTRKV